MYYLVETDHAKLLCTTPDDIFDLVSCCIDDPILYGDINRIRRFNTDTFSIEEYQLVFNGHLQLIKKYK